MLPVEYTPTRGDRLYDMTDNKEFTVLCSCPNSRPRRHTTSFIKQNRGEFMTPAQHKEVEEQNEKG